MGEDGKRLGTGARDRNRNLCGAFESQVERERWALDLRGIVWDRMGMERANENGGWVLATAARLAAPRSATSTSTIRSLELDLHLGAKKKYLQADLDSSTITTTITLYYSTDCNVPTHGISCVCVRALSAVPAQAPYYLLLCIRYQSCYENLEVLSPGKYHRTIYHNKRMQCGCSARQQVREYNKHGEKQQTNVRNSSLCV